MFTPANRNRKFVSTTPPPISPRPNRDRAPLHQPHYLATIYFGPNGWFYPTPPATFEYDCTRTSENTWSFHDTSDANHFWRGGGSWNPGTNQLTFTFDISTDDVNWTNIINATFAAYNGVLIYNTGPQWFDPSTHDDGTYQVRTRGPWQPFTG